MKFNYALIVPTKALINEVSSKIISDLGALLKEMNYRVVTSAGALALEEEHNFIYVLTPERLLYLLIRHKDKDIDYLFIDEAHKITSKAVSYTHLDVYKRQVLCLARNIVDFSNNTKKGKWERFPLSLIHI